MDIAASVYYLAMIFTTAMALGIYVFLIRDKEGVRK